MQIESAYLKNHIGGVLAKAVAETVVAQPSNPQEYLALYLLHHLQEQDRKAAQASRQKKVSKLTEEWNTAQAAREKAAADTITRGVSTFRAKIAAKKKAEAALQAAYEEAVGDAEDLLEQEEAVRAEQQQVDETNYEAHMNEENKTTYEKLQEEEERLEETRTEFYRQQRFMLELQKSHLGALKNHLVEYKDRVRIGKAELESIADNTAAETLEAAELDWRVNVKQEAQVLSPAAAALAARAAGHRSHDRISVHHALYRVLRCLCYLLLDATPKATDSAEKVAALLKPTVLAATLRAFNPVASYDRARALRLERALPSNSGEEDGADDTDSPMYGAEDEEGDSYPMPQAKTRQVRRAQRVLRALLADAEYICELNPADFFDEDYIEEEEEDDQKQEQEGGASTKPVSLKEEIAAAEAAIARAKVLRESVEEQTRQRGGLVLWSLLKYLSAAVAFRQNRDTVVTLRRELGLDISNTVGDSTNPVGPLLEEIADDEEEDENNDEVIFDEEGEVDVNEVRRLQARIGTDEDEQLVKLWEAKDAQTTTQLEGRAEAFRLAAEAEEEEEEDDEAEGDE